MTKAEAKSLFNRRLKILRLALFGTGGRSEYSYYNWPIYKQFHEEGKIAGEAERKRLNKEHKEFLKKLNAMMAQARSLRGEYAYLLVGVGPDSDETTEFYFGGSTGAERKARQFKHWFDMQMLNLEEQFLINYSDDPEAAKQFIDGLPKIEDLLTQWKEANAS